MLGSAVIPLCLKLSLRRGVIDKLTEDIIGTGPMWHSDDTPWYSRAHR